MDFASILGTGNTPPVQAAPAQAMAPQSPEASPEATGSSFGGGFMDKLRTDPAFSQAMLMMGARLMQGPKNGQDFAGLVGDAALIGATAHGFVRANEQSQALKEKEFALKEKEANVRMAGQQAQTAATVQETSQKAELFPQTKLKVAEEVKNLRIQGRKAEADALLAEFKSDPKRMAQIWNLDVQAKQAHIGQSNAAAGASNASAQLSNANARLANVRADAATNLQFEGQDEAVLHGTGKRGAAGAKQKMEEMDTYLKAAYPDMPEQERAAKVARMFDPSKMKGEDLQTLRVIAENGSGAQQKFALDQLYQMATSTAKANGTMPPPAPAPTTTGKPAKTPKRGEAPYVVRTGKRPDGTRVEELSDGTIRDVK